MKETKGGDLKAIGERKSLNGQGKNITDFIGKGIL